VNGDRQTVTKQWQ